MPEEGDAHHHADHAEAGQQGGDAEPELERAVGDGSDAQLTDQQELLFDSWNSLRREIESA